MANNIYRYLELDKLLENLVEHLTNHETLWPTDDIKLLKKTAQKFIVDDEQLAENEVRYLVNLGNKFL